MMPNGNAYSPIAWEPSRHAMLWKTSAKLVCRETLQMYSAYNVLHYMQKRVKNILGKSI
jgi:hypothetical protein